MLSEGGKTLGGMRTLSDQTGRGNHGFLLMASCDVDQASWEVKSLGHGAFTWFLCQGIQGDARDEDGMINVFGLANYVSNKTKRYVYKNLNVVQVPTFRPSGEMTNFPIGKAGGTDVKVRKLAEAAWQLYQSKDYKGALAKINESLEQDSENIQNKAIKEMIVAAMTPASPSAPSEDGRTLQAGAKKTISIKGIAYTFRWCPAGTFEMGSPESERERRSDERQHKVTISNGFWLLEHEVTQEMWESVMGTNPSRFKGNNLPVESVSWNECQDFIDKVQDIAPGGVKIALPSEAEWEYACRAGTTTPFSFGRVLNGYQANHNGKYPYGTETKGPYLEKTTPVKKYEPNAWGLYDIHGNVWEWCNDWYDGDYYTNSPSTDPPGPDSGSYRVNRGGSCINLVRSCRSAYRSGTGPAGRNNILGFRLALSSTH